MTPFARLLGLALPACGSEGASGLAEVQPLDFGRLKRDRKPNSALAAPAEFHPAPDVLTPVFPLPAAALIRVVEQVGRAQPRTMLLKSFPVRMQLWFVARSRWLNFPDLITAQAVARDTDSSTLLVYSRSVYGYSDFGVNHRRVANWVAAIDATVRRSAESSFSE